MTMASLVHELVNWSSQSEQCDVQKFSEKYGRYVPLLVRVADGYAGRDESMHNLAQNEVYWVHDIIKQPRVIATDHDENYFSIPLDYKQRFCIVERGQKSSAKPLRDIIDRLKMRDVDFVVEGNSQISFSVGADLGDNKELGPLRFDTMHDLKYLLAYPIMDNYLQPKLSAIPAYMPVMLDVAKGFKYGTDSDFKQFGKELQKAVQRFDKTPITLCNDILMSEEAPEPDYEYVNPIHVVLINDDRDDVATTTPPSPRLADNNNNNNNLRSRQASNTESQRYATAGSSHIKSKPVYLPAMPTVHQTTDTTSTEKRRGPPVAPRKQLSTIDRLRWRLDRDGYLGCVFMPTVSNDDEDDDDEDSRCAQAGRGRDSYRRQAFSRRRRANSVDSLLSWQPALATSMSDSESTISTRRRCHPPPPYTNRQRPSPSLKFRGDLGLVPTNIASLSVEEIGECLCLLHLDKYVDAFYQMDVDGQLLVSLNVQVLTTDFNCTQFEAIKLMKFAVEGWRPLKRSASPDL